MQQNSSKDWDETYQGCALEEIDWDELRTIELNIRETVDRPQKKITMFIYSTKPK